MRALNMMSMESPFKFRDYAMMKTAEEDFSE